MSSAKYNYFPPVSPPILRPSVSLIQLGTNVVTDWLPGVPNSLAPGFSTLLGEMLKAEKIDADDFWTANQFLIQFERHLRPNSHLRVINILVIYKQTLTFVCRLAGTRTHFAVFRFLELRIEWVSELALSVTGLHLLISSLQLVQETRSRPTSSWGFSTLIMKRTPASFLLIEFGGFRVERVPKTVSIPSHIGFKE